MRLTLEKDHTTGQDDALLDIYRKLRPGEPPTTEAAQTLLDNLYFNRKRYDLAKVGRYKVNKKLGLEGELSQSTLTVDDIVATIKYVVALHAGEETLPGSRRGEVGQGKNQKQIPHPGEPTAGFGMTGACATPGATFKPSPTWRLAVPANAPRRFGGRKRWPKSLTPEGVSYINQRRPVARGGW